MEISLSESLVSLEPKIRILANQRDQARERLKEVIKENDRLRLELEDTRRQLQESRVETEYLSLSHKLADNPQAIADARGTVRRMLARVEKAIALLEEDARI